MVTGTERRLERPIFVVGPPRSGTTVLRHALNRHPDLAITPETHLLDQWLPRYPDLWRGTREAFEPFWDAYRSGPDFARSELAEAVVLERLAAWGDYGPRDVFAALMLAWADAAGSPRCGEKTPDHAHHVATLLAWFPDARVLWVRRDPRDVAASEVAFDQPWAADDVARPARAWRRTERALRRWSGDPRVLVVAYEELARDPEVGLQRILGHVGARQAAEVLAAPGRRPGVWHGGHDPGGALTAASVGRWRERLDARDVGRVDGLTWFAAPRAGYPRARRSLDPSQRSAYLRGVATSIAGELVGPTGRRLVQRVRRRGVVSGT